MTQGEIQVSSYDDIVIMHEFCSHQLVPKSLPIMTGSINIYQYERYINFISCEVNLQKNPSPPQIFSILIELLLKANAHPPDLPLESKVWKIQPGSMFDRILLMEPPFPKVSCSNNISILTEPIRLLSANFLSELAKPLQLKDRHFMG